MLIDDETVVDLIIVQRRANSRLFAFSIANAAQHYRIEQGDLAVVDLESRAIENGTALISVDNKPPVVCYISDGHAIVSTIQFEPPSRFKILGQVIEIRRKMQ